MSQRESDNDNFSWKMKKDSESCKGSYKYDAMTFSETQMIFYSFARYRDTQNFYLSWYRGLFVVIWWFHIRMIWNVCCSSVWDSSTWRNFECDQMRYFISLSFSLRFYWKCWLISLLFFYDSNITFIKFYVREKVMRTESSHSSVS